MKKVLVVNNYDSFVYNVVQALRESDYAPQVEIRMNDRVTREDVAECRGVVLSPGPGLPCEGNRLGEVVQEVIRLQKTVLGICLGHQALAEAFGARLEQMAAPLHGHPSRLEITDPRDTLLAGCVNPVVGRYHSWVVARDSMPDSLRVSALDEEGHIMAFYHERLPIHGVQFHPESVITDQGRLMIDNWLKEL